MKRGFLNSAKGKKAISIPSPSTASPPATTKDLSSKTQGAGTIAASNLAENIAARAGDDSTHLSNGIANDLDGSKPIQGSESTTASTKAAIDKIANKQEKVTSSITQDVVSGMNAIHLSGINASTIAIPTDYKPWPMSIVDYGLERASNRPDDLVFHIVSSRSVSGAKAEGGQTVWLGIRSTLAKVVSSPGFPQPLPKSASSTGKLAYIIQSTTDKGLGVFATRDIEKDEIIFSERPLIVTPASNAGFAKKIQGSLKRYDTKTAIAIAMMEWEKQLAGAVERMLPEDRADLMQLANSHTQDGSGPIMGISRTNGFGIGSHIHDGDVLRPDGANAYSAVMRIACRINHSCMPNIKMEFTKESFSFQCKAMVDLKAGQELFYSYCAIDASVAERRAQLKSYGFVCKCDACEHATPETDAVRKEYKARLNYYMHNINWIAQRGGKEKDLEPILKLRNDLLKEGLNSQSEYHSTVFMLMKFYEGAGMMKKAKPFREEFKRFKLPEHP